MAFGKAAPRPIKTAVITSQKAGVGTARAGLSTVIGSMLATPYRHYDTATLGELDAAAKSIAANRTDVTFFTGGDGALHVIVTRLIREYAALGLPMPLLGYIPTGTMMNTGRSLDLDRLSAVDFAKRLSAKVEAQNRGEDVPFNITHLNPILVNDQYGFIYGAGIPVNFLREYEKGGYYCQGAIGLEPDKLLRALGIVYEYCDFRCKWAPAHAKYKLVCPKCGCKLFREGLGPWQAIKVILGSLFSRRKRRELMKPVYARVVLPDGQEKPVAPAMEHTALMVATVDQLGMGMRGMPEAMSRPNHFMLRSTQMNYWRLALPTTLGALWAGLPLPQTFDAVLPSVIIEYEEPTVATLDGDMLPASDRHVISCGPMLRFITG